MLWVQNNLRNDILTPFFKVITSLGNAGAVWILISVLLMFIKKTRRTGITCAASLTISFILNNLFLKNLIARPRPYNVIPDLTALIPYPHDFSFPSGHTAASFAVAVVIFIKMPKKYGIPALILAFLIAFSRIYLGVHYPTDVLFGMFTATTIAILSCKYIKDKGRNLVEI